jgi:hypothetical protein
MEGKVRIVNGFEIWEGDPVEVEIGRRGRPSEWPFAAMRLWEIFYVNDKDRFNSVYMAVRYLHSRTDMKFTVNKWPAQRWLESKRGERIKSTPTGLRVRRVR